MKTIAFNRRLVATVSLSLSLATNALAAQNKVIITPSPGDLDGNSTSRPFNNPQPGRFQQVYDASLFAALPTGGGSILEFAFRVDPWAESFSAPIGNLQINLSTTTRGIDDLSPIFDENIRADNLVVLGPGRVGIGGGGGGGLSTYSVSFYLSQPFHYDPAMGNLLLDFRIIEGAGTEPGRIGTLDAFDVVGDRVSSVYAYGSTLPTVGQVSSLGLATAFSITPVPEPSTWALLGIGCAAALAVRRQKNNQKEGSHVIA